MTSRTLPAVLAASVLALAACGGSSGDGNGSPLSGGDDELDIAEQVLEQNGIDVDELVADALDGDEEVDLDDLDLDELGSDASDAIDSLSTGAGSATITIDGVAYQMDAASCFDFDGSLNLDGPGLTASGESFWGAIDYTVNDRAEMLESGLFEEEFLQQMFGDKQQAIDLSVSVTVGQLDRFESAPDGLPEYTADVFMDNPVFGTLTFQRDGSTVSGSGEMTDSNGVAVGYGELIPFEFSASCA